MRFMAGMILFLFLAPLAFATSGVYIPKGWVEVKRPDGGVTFHLPDDSEGITLGFIPFFSSSPLSELHQFVTASKRVAVSLHAFNGKADKEGKMAECELLATWPRGVKTHQKVYVLKSGHQYLLVTTYAAALIYPGAAKALDSVRERMFRFLASARPPVHASIPAHAEKAAVSKFRFKTVDAGIYYIKIPESWRVIIASGGEFQARSPEGDNAFIYSLQVPGDAQTYRYQMSGYRMLRLSQQALAFLARIYDPYLSPVQVVQSFYPQLGGGLIQNMRVMREKKIPARGWEESLVGYAYDSRSRHGSGPYDGGALVITIPSRYKVAGADFWTLIIEGGEGPSTLYGEHLPVYNAIFSSVKVNQEGLREYLQNQGKLNQTIQQGIGAENEAINDRQKMLATFGQTMIKMQNQTFQTWQNEKYHEALGWNETYAQETPVYDTQTGARFTLPNSYIDAFQSQGRNVRATFTNPNIGTQKGDVLQTVPVGTW